MAEETSGLILGGVIVPLVAGLDLSQTYDQFGGVWTARAMNGAAIRREHWRKLRTQISGSGWIPPGLHALDYSTPLTLSCIAPRMLRSATNSLALPAARRSDTGYTPYAWAVMADGSAQATPVAMASNTATATAVSGAQAYLFFYFPTLSVYAEPPAERFDPRGAVAGWDLTAEEV